MFVYHRFELNETAVKTLRSMTPVFGYGQLGEILFYRTYSRSIRHKETGQVVGQEHWPDVVIRVTNGTISIRKDWYIKNHIEWDEAWWQEYATRFAISMFKMEWLPPGRGLNHMGAEHIYERGSMALFNCGYTEIGDDIADDIAWLMDALMLGVGVGFKAIRNDKLWAWIPKGKQYYTVPDKREGWTEATRCLIDSYLKPGQPEYVFDYSEIRPKGSPIKTFGGVCNGPDDLVLLHDRIRYFFKMYVAWINNPEIAPYYDVVMLKTDIANAVGVCVISGNVRRSAEIGLGEIDDQVFMDLKDYSKYPYRAGWGYMSNNSVMLRKTSDFEKLGEIARRVIKNGEPGYVNMINMKYARIGKKMKGLRFDEADGWNP